MGKKKVFFLWLEDYKWFQYSKLFDGAFCLSCEISGHQIGVNSSKVDKLDVGPFIDWSYAVARFKCISDQAPTKLHYEPCKPLLV